MNRKLFSIVAATLTIVALSGCVVPGMRKPGYIEQHGPVNELIVVDTSDELPPGEIVEVPWLPDKMESWIPVNELPFVDDGGELPPGGIVEETPVPQP